MPNPKNYVLVPSELECELVVRMEGGAVYTSNKDGKFKIIINESAMLDALGEEESIGMEPISEIEFSSNEERLEYLKERNWQKCT